MFTESFASLSAIARAGRLGVFQGVGCAWCWVCLSLPPSRCMALSHYVGVTRPLINGKPAGWLAQCKRLRIWRVGFKSQAAAAEWLAKKLRVKPEALRRRTRPRGPHQESGVSYYRGVVPHRRGVDGRCRWAAWARGRRRGTFSSQAAAAKEVARILRVSVRSLGKKMSGKRARQIFRAAHQVFKHYCPGDVKYTRKQEHLFQRQFKQECSKLLIKGRLPWG